MEKLKFNLYKNTNKLGDVWYTYQESPESEEIRLTPLNKTGDDPAYWTFTDKNGRLYLPLKTFSLNKEEINQAKKPNVLDNLIAISNRNYNHPILGTPARWQSSWSNNTNPIKALWNSPFIFTNPYLLGAKTIGNLASKEGIPKTIRLYNNSKGSYTDKYAWQKSLAGDLLESTMLLPVISGAKNVSTNLYNTTSFNTVLNRITHPIESIKISNIAGNIMKDYSSELNNAFKNLLKNTKYFNRGDASYYTGEISGLRKATDFRRAHELGHLFQDAIYKNNIQLRPINPTSKYQYTSGVEPDVNFAEHFADLFGVKYGNNYNTDKVINNLGKDYLTRIPIIELENPTNILIKGTPEPLPYSRNYEITPVAPYNIKRYPGYQLGILMKGNPLEKQLSKTGTISVNSIKAQAAKGSNVEKAVINEVLGSEQFVGQKAIDYNAFRKAVQDRLITYNRVPSKQWEDYGVKSLGFEDQASHDAPNIRFNETTGEFEQVGEFTEFKPDYQLNTFTFESPRIPVGDNTHYNPSTLGHSRTYTTTDEPNVLHVMESQSDWALKNVFGDMAAKRSKLLEKPELWAKREASAERLATELADWENMVNTGVNHGGVKLQPWELELIKTEFIPRIKAQLIKTKAILASPTEIEQASYLTKNYLQRQLQENMKYAAEHGQTKMRYPTSETAAKIEGYPETFNTRNLTESQMKVLDQLDEEKYSYWADHYNVSRGLDAEYMTNLNKGMSPSEWKSLIERLGVTPQYSSEHQTILKKYSDFPKMYNKLYKGAEVRTVTDAKGNTWYEVDVPKDYLNQEWKFKYGGLISSKSGKQIIKNFKQKFLKKK